MTTKLDIAKNVAQNIGIKRKDAEKAVEKVLDCIKTSLKEREKITLVGFGTFYMKDKPARKGRNPRTGEDIDIPRKFIATFKPGKKFREEVEESK